MTTNKFIHINPEIESALAARKPVIALESTVIAHGLPQPQNLETAQRLEQIIRDEDSIPATIAVLRGKFCVGLDSRQLEHLATSTDIRKISTRDLAVAMANEWDGATTVASTMWIAQRAGIKVFATGGIGGVHRGSLPDVSADLPELTQTPMIVVCSGAKIVLDLPATREWLETYGVTVVGYGCDEMPGFYSRHSGLPIDVRCDSPAAVTVLFNAQRGLGVTGALLVTVPVPAAAEIPDEELKSILDQSLRDAERSHVSGRELTPFLLARMAQLSKGTTLRANIALLENNARVAAQIARELG
ncbi:MAG TPA: pseudouridine-5'-phosphate glycosidase [Pyrinomonadaceae bacterium]|nr:pseudouridine-5'-phosphate glycosidase [Pyrinomonadaceae bacterium]